MLKKDFCDNYWCWLKEGLKSQPHTSLRIPEWISGTVYRSGENIKSILKKIIKQEKWVTEGERPITIFLENQIREGTKMRKVELVSLGDEVKDPITGLKGVVVARSEWLWGCVRIGVQPKGIKDGKPFDEVWFDENRVVITKMGPRSRTAMIEKSVSPPGGPGREGQKKAEG
jgi:hypothetical protein